MAIMRHSDFKMTMEVYAQASDKATREALRKLSESFETED
jgi:integrase